MKFFIGDVTEFVKEFDRSQVSVKWVNNDIYGQLLGIFIRLDVKKVDEEAGFFGTYTDVVKTLHHTYVLTSRRLMKMLGYSEPTLML